MTDNCIPNIVAHRGYADCYPENSLDACSAAHEAGIKYIEIDIQLSADHVPYLLHDQNLLRTAGHDRLITAMHSNELDTLDIANNTPTIANNTYLRPVRLTQYVELLKTWRDTTTFVEIKTECLEIFGRDVVCQAVMSTLRPILERCVIISYDLSALQHIQTTYGSATHTIAIGWVLKHYDTDHYRQAEEIKPDFLICNHEKIDRQPLWKGPWQWLLYEVKTPELAIHLCQQGADMVETMAIGELLKDHRFNNNYKDTT